MEQIKGDSIDYKSIVSSFVGVIASHPIDTVKTNKQVGNISTFNIIKKIHSNKNIGNVFKQYYKGIKYPLLFVPIEKGLVFNFDNYLYKQCEDRTLSGLGAGIGAGFFVNFVENYKINKQNIFNKNNVSFISRFTNGLNQTVFREGIGYMIYFKSYHDYYKHMFPSFIAGGLSGVTAWIVIYPFDHIKTLVQTGNSISHLGVRNIYKGCSLSLARAMVMHGCVFAGYEMLTELYE